MNTKAKTIEEQWLVDRLIQDLPSTEQIDSLEVRFEKNNLSDFAIYVVLSLGNNFNFELRDSYRRKIRRIVTSAHPAADIFIRFV